MNILFIADPLSSFKIYKDTTFIMMKEMALRGWSLSHTLASELSIHDGIVYAECSSIDFNLHSNTDPHNWFQVADKNRIALNAFDAVIMRTDPPFDLQYLYATQLLSLAEQQNARIFNSGQAMRDFNEKLAILNFPQFIAPTIVATQASQIKDFLQQHQDIIVKPLDGMGGMGIFRLRIADPNINSILETLMHMNSRTIMAQRYIPEIVHGDKRVLVINGQVIPYVLARIPQNGETRGNLAAGGKGVAQPISPRERSIAENLAPKLLNQGILLAGLDIIGDYLTEINITSPTGFQEIMQQTDCNVASIFADAIADSLHSS